MVYSLAFSGDSAMLASGGADNTVRLWDAKKILGLGSGGAAGPGVPAGSVALNAGGAAGGIGNLAGSGAHLAGTAAGAVALMTDEYGSSNVRGGGGLIALRPRAPAPNRWSQPSPRVLARATLRDRGAETTELLATLRTKSSPIQLVQFTYRNILLAAGAYMP